MKRNISLLAAALLLVAPTGLTPWASAQPQRAQPAMPLSGFMDVAWGASMTQGKDTLTARGATYRLSGRAYPSNLSLVVNGLPVEGYPTDAVLVHFGNEGFYDADVFFPKPYKGAKLHNELKRVFTQRFGPPSAVKKVNYPERVDTVTQWIFQRPAKIPTGPKASKKRVMVQLSISQDNELMLTYRDIERNEREGARQQAYWNKVG